MLTARKIWNGLKMDRRFQDLPDPIQAMWRQIIQRMLDSSLPTLSMLVTTQVICDMKIQFLRILVDNGFVRRIINAIPDLDMREKDDRMIEFAEIISRRIDRLRSDTFNTITVREDKNLDERLYMLGSKVGLRGAARRAYERGELTVGKLLELQPEVLIPWLPI